MRTKHCMVCEYWDSFEETCRKGYIEFCGQIGFSPSAHRVANDILTLLWNAGYLSPSSVELSQILIDEHFSTKPLDKPKKLCYNITTPNKNKKRR